MLGSRGSQKHTVLACYRSQTASAEWIQPGYLTKLRNRCSTRAREVKGQRRERSSVTTIR